MPPSVVIFFFNDTATTEIYTLSLHDALPISGRLTHVARLASQLVSPPGAAALSAARPAGTQQMAERGGAGRSEEHTSELQSLRHLVCRLLLEKKKKNRRKTV